MFKNSLIVSCQAEENEPLHGSVHMQRMAIAAVQSGAKGIRANSAEDVRAIKECVDVPVIGLIKDRSELYEAFITTTREQIDLLINAGADYVAIDSTRVSRPELLETLYLHVHETHPDTGIVADISDIEDVKNILQLKPDFISTTLSGYTEYTRNRKKPDLDLIDEIKEITNIPIIAEGNYQKPNQIRQAILRGAFSVIVGGAITRPQQITERFVNAISDFKDEIMAIGIDLGATRLRAVVIDRYGNIIDSQIVETPDNADEIVNTTANLIKKLQSKYPEINTVGIATAGRVDSKAGTILYATDNIKGWTGRAFGNEITTLTGMTPAVNNDANLAAYGQWKKSKEESMALITVGTGIGGGIVLNGKILNGAFGGGAEIGHITVPGNNKLCTCSKTGCIETIASGKVLGERFKENPEQVEQILDEICLSLSWLIDTVQRIVEVERIYLSGSIVKYGDDILKRINNNLMNIDSKYNTEFVVFSDLREMAGAVGAALYSLDQQIND